MSDIILKDESYKIVGICMEVHRGLGIGFKENVYKEALEIEFRNNGVPIAVRGSLKLNTRALYFPINISPTL